MVSLQAVRAIGSVLVAVWHLDWVANDIPSLQSVSLPSFARFGYAGVDLFFVLSGFVMAESLSRRPKQSATEFILNRAKRVCPSYWIATSAELGLLTLSGVTAGLTLPLAVASFLMLPMQEKPVLGVGWTLEHEALFYVEIAVLLLAGLSTHLIAFMGIASVASIAFHAWSVDRPWDYHVLSAYNVQFFLGVALQKVLCRRRCSAGLLWLGVLMFPITAWAMTALLDGGLPPTQPAGLDGLVRVIMFGLGSVCLIAGFVECERRGVLGGYAAALLSWMGDLSFAMYLVHPIIYQMYGRLLAFSGFGSGTSQAWGACLLAVAFVLTILASLAFFRFIERPFLRSRLHPGWTPTLEVSMR